MSAILTIGFTLVVCVGLVVVGALIGIDYQKNRAKEEPK